MKFFLLSLVGIATASPITINLDVNNDLQKRDLYSDTANELSKCAPVTVIFARGTIESGNIGALVGPPFVNALAATIGASNLGVQGVPYPATIAGYLAGGDAQGSANLAALTEQAASQCPHTQIVLSGYSQGAQLVHNGAKQISAATAQRVKAVVVFGDPDDNQAIQNISPTNVETFCFALDTICEDSIVVGPSHFLYSVDVTPAAQYVAARVSF